MNESSLALVELALYATQRALIAARGNRGDQTAYLIRLDLAKYRSIIKSEKDTLKRMEAVTDMVRAMRTYMVFIANYPRPSDELARLAADMAELVTILKIVAPILSAEGNETVAPVLTASINSILTRCLAEMVKDALVEAAAGSPRITEDFIKAAEEADYFVVRMDRQPIRYQREVIIPTEKVTIMAFLRPLLSVQGIEELYARVELVLTAWLELANSAE